MSGSQRGRDRVLRLRSGQPRASSRGAATTAWSGGSEWLRRPGLLLVLLVVLAALAPVDAVRLLRERFEPAAILDARSVRSAPAVLAGAGVVGGATYDGLVALAARSAGLPLATRDRRAQNTYRILDVQVEMLG